MRSEAFERAKQLFDAALREHERQLSEAVAAFNRLSPSEQQAEQLRKWQQLLTGSNL